LFPQKSYQIYITAQAVRES